MRACSMLVARIGPKSRPWIVNSRILWSLAWGARFACALTLPLAAQRAHRCVKARSALLVRRRRRICARIHVQRRRRGRAIGGVVVEIDVIVGRLQPADSLGRADRVA
eukprot:951247-Prymnesium_polylepis.1